ncbi:YdcF family protein [Vibrio sp. DNB22_10_4]
MVSEKEFDNLLIVLGKRLNQDTLTLEGESRVEALAEIVKNQDMSTTIVAFCGGITEGQSRSEAAAMLEYFQRLVTETDIQEMGAILVEDASTNTVENIQLLAKELTESGIVPPGSRPIRVTLLSNDYHLYRVFTVQRLLDQQGLLKYLVQCCQQAGLAIQLSYDPLQHVFVPYPHKETQGNLFVLFDRLTIYRVYLQGAVTGVFSEPLSELAAEPYRIALASLEALDKQVDHTSGLFTPLYEQLPTIRQFVEATVQLTEPKSLALPLAELDKLLTNLNRYLDPEQAQQ